ncbi:lipocalin family protein [Herminiimonas glaciei]|uniref:Outer membrane lipoprotein Blc n=1 Tax=Herminiimonas glaciei TaxID=523788 RepID=A0ABW2IDB7_9BURK
MKKLLVATALFAACLSAPSWAQQVSTVVSVDLARYTGKWYEIARFPNRFQDDCIANVTAQYDKRADGDIDVTNRCLQAGGKIDEAVGRARVDDSGTNAKLKVRFVPDWLGWIPYVWADYWIIDLDPAYTLAAVGGPTRDYLWVLSRTPIVPEAEYEALVNRVTAQGFDTAKLVKTRQDSAGK